MKKCMVLLIALMGFIPATTSRAQSAIRPDSSLILTNYFRQMQPQPSVEATNLKLTFYLIQVVSSNTNPDEEEIRPIVTELRKIFKYPGYRVGSKSVLLAAVGNDGYARATQAIAALPQEGETDRTPYTIEVFADAKSADVTMLHVTLKQAGFPTLIDASVNVKDGKTVVLGTAQKWAGGPIILAVTPDVQR